MRLAWFLMVIGALCVFEAIALMYTGYYVKNILIEITGLCIGIGLGIFPFRYGWKKRKEILAERNPVSGGKETDK